MDGVCVLRKGRRVAEHVWPAWIERFVDRLALVEESRAQVRAEMDGDSIVREAHEPLAKA